MASHLYRLRMGKYAEALVRRRKRETLEMLWFQYNLMRLGNELAGSKNSGQSGISAVLSVHSLRNSCTTLKFGFERNDAKI